MSRHAYRTADLETAARIAAEHGGAYRALLAGGWEIRISGVPRSPIVRWVAFRRVIQAEEHAPVFAAPNAVCLELLAQIIGQGYPFCPRSKYDKNPTPA